MNRKARSPNETLAANLRTKEKSNAAQNNPRAFHRRRARRHGAGTDLRFCLGRTWWLGLAWWLAWSGLPRVRRPGLCRPGLWRLPGADLGRDAVRTGAALGQSLLLVELSSRLRKRQPRPRQRPGCFRLKPIRCDQARSKRSRFITLPHAATKSFTNFSFASA